MGGLVDAIFGGGSKAPPPPDYGPVAQASERVGLEQVQLGREQLEYQKQRELGDRRLLAPVIEQQIESSRKNEALADNYTQYMFDTFRPLERDIVKDAQEYDSPQRQEAEAQRAGSEVRGAYDRQRQSGARTAGRFGPVSADEISRQDYKMGLVSAADESAAMNNARRAVQDAGVARKLNAAQLGRNLPANQVSSTQVGLTAGNSAVQNQLGVADSGIRGAASSLPFTQAGLSGIGQAGNIMNQAYANQMAGYNASQQSSNGMFGALGNIAGQFAGSKAGSALISTWLSDENEKEDKEPVDANLILDGLTEIPVESWKYKDGAADGGQHIGPYAQDVNAVFGEEAAPGGTSIDPVTMNGLTMAGLQALARKVKKLEEGAGLAPIKRAAKRDTEPRRVAA